MSETLADLGPYLALVLAGFLPNEVWRWLGAVAARRLDEGSELLVWVRAVATAVLAGVIAQLIFVPPGALATVPFSVRIAAMAVGFVAYLTARRSLLAGVAAGEITLVLGAFLSAG
jgi:hypothetical protein